MDVVEGGERVVVDADVGDEGGWWRGRRGVGWGVGGELDPGYFVLEVDAVGGDEGGCH